VIIAVAGCTRNCTEPCDSDEPECASWNGSFECNGRPELDGWRFGNSGLAFSTQDAPAGGGEWCLRLEADWAPTLGFAFAPISDVKDGDLIHLSAFVRAGNENGGGSIALYVGRCPYSQGGSWKSVSTEEANWTHLSLEDTVTVAEGDSVWVILSSFDTEIAPRTGLFDMVTVDRVRK
jgi:hypothetical protein